MTQLARQVYVISDLHLGGVYPNPDVPGDRGFRICTHADAVADFIRSLADRPASAPPAELVVNGDMVDFLAERHSHGPEWRPFNADSGVAVELLRAIVDRDRVVFDAMAAFLAAGHRLVILLGNHDVEMALPQVRAALADELDAVGRDFTFIHDGEAYVVGDALIEHGNEYDRWNRVNYAQLRRIRADLSRFRTDRLDFFEPPAGSLMVADVINPIKEDYRFVDLLKPQNGAAIPMLLALEPGLRPLIGKAAKFAATAQELAARRKAANAVGADISASGEDDATLGADIGGMGGMGGMSGMGGGGGARAAAPDDEVTRELKAVLGRETEAFHEALAVGEEVEREVVGSDISAMGTARLLVGGLRLLLTRGDGSTEAVRKRFPALLQALRSNQDSTAFDRGTESGTEYWDAAKELAQGPIKHVVFGHTHLPKRVELPSGGYYLNSGTWADVLRFPDRVIEGSHDEQMAALGGFVDALRANDFSDYTLFRPTYVRLDVGPDGAVAEAALCDYDASTRSEAS